MQHISQIKSFSRLCSIWTKNHKRVINMFLLFRALNKLRSFTLREGKNTPFYLLLHNSSSLYRHSTALHQLVDWSSRSSGNLAATFLAIFSELHFFLKNISQWMQSTRYLYRMGMIANVSLVLSKKKALKNINFLPIWTRPKKRDGFFRHLHDHESVIQKIWPKIWPPNFHLISNFNIQGVSWHWTPGNLAKSQALYKSHTLTFFLRFYY